MFRLIRFESLFRWLAVGTTGVSLLIYLAMQAYLGTEFSISLLVKVAGWVSFALIVCLTTDIPARMIWGFLRFFNKRLFPDLNGTWEGEIIVSDSRKIPARAIIRHSLLKVQIDIHTETSKSVTIETTPTLEFNQYKIYYVYRSIPKNPEWSEYKGTTTFDIRSVKFGAYDALEMSGEYFTSRMTVGRVRFRQVSSDTSCDVSYY